MALFSSRLRRRVFLTVDSRLLSGRRRHFAVSALDSWKSAVECTKKHDACILYFTSKRSGLCQKEIAPFIEKLSEMLTNITFFKIDIDHVPESVEKANITVVPTVHVYARGELLNAFQGPEELLSNMKDIAKK